MEKAKKIYSIIVNVFLAVAIILAVLLLGVRLFGLTPYTVLSGSMGKTYPAGSVVYVVKKDPLTLEVGDVITFYKEDGKVVTHRIIEIIDDDPTAISFRAQGDANNTPDDPIPSERVIGKVAFGLPLLGYVVNFIQRPPGNIVAIGFCLLLVLLSALPELLRKEEDEEKQEE